MAIKNWTVPHKSFTCDKCGHQEIQAPDQPKVDVRAWLELSLRLPSLGDPLAMGTRIGEQSKGMLLCPGCRGMLETFLEIGLSNMPVTTAQNVAGAGTPSFPRQLPVTQHAAFKAMVEDIDKMDTSVFAKVFDRFFNK
jgi:hypothetical protein